MVKKGGLLKLPHIAVIFKTNVGKSSTVLKMEILVKGHDNLGGLCGMSNRKLINNNLSHNYLTKLFVYGRYFPQCTQVTH